MPHFPACLDEKDYPTRKACADRAMFEYVYAQITYPPALRDATVTGLAVVTFVVATDGRLEDIRVMRDPGGGLGEVAAEAVHRMNADHLRWQPGRHHGKPVPVQYNLPVRFNLE